ncbi:MAG: glycosyltransferase family 39 protein [Lachnospiraceae bacterium]|nr:glycosyltransferase family 39 protein [Lachnospiraceae bacterium]
MINKKREKWILALLLVLSAAVYISLVFNNNVWMDEAFTATLVRTDMAGVLTRSMNDTLPPLYNILLKLATDLFGYKVPVMKLLSAFFMIATAFAGGFLVRRRFGLRAAVLFVLAVTFMPNMLFFGVEIRMYSLGFFCATLNGILAVECVKAPRFSWFFAFTVVSVLAGYSHHFAFVTVGFVYFFLLLYYILFEREHIRRFFICLAATAVLYLPCLLVTLQQIRQVNGYFSMPEVTPAVFVKYMRYPFTTGFTPLSVLLLLTVAALFVRLLYTLLKNKSMQPSGELYVLCCFLIYYGVLIFGTVISKLMTANIFVDRYLFFAMGLLWLFFSIEGASLRKPLFIALVVLELLVGAVSYKTAFASEYAPGAEELTAFLKENVREGDLLYTIEDAEGLSLSLPFYDDRLEYIQTLPVPSGRVSGEEGPVIWCAVLDGYEDGAPAFEGYTAEYVGDFTFDRYAFRLYKLTGKN